jgi:CHAD domain-containing protein
MAHRIEATGKTAKRSRSAPGLEAEPVVEADCVGVVRAMAKAIVALRDEVLRDPSPANVHAFRGGLRRAGGALKFFKVEVGDEDEAWSRAELKWLARQYGDVRDLDVLIGRLEAPSQAWTNAVRNDEVVLGAALGARKAAALTALTATASARALGIVNGLAAWSELWRPPAKHAGHAAYAAALSAADAKIRGYGRRIGDFSSHARHRLRARIKILRYECETMTQMTAPPGVSGYELKLTVLHQILGDMHDAEVGAKLAPQFCKDAADRVGEQKIATERRHALKAAWSDFRAATSPWAPAVRLGAGPILDAVHVVAS